jgi:hypothetical protein
MLLDERFPERGIGVCGGKRRGGKSEGGAFQEGPAMDAAFLFLL